MKLTEWFGPEVNPTMPGWYERHYYWHSEEYAKTLCNDYWDGSEWKIGTPSGSKYPGAAKDLKWRGLAEKP